MSDAVHGVSLEQYAGVTVALAEGLPIEAILANERIPADAWARADVAWKVRAAKDASVLAQLVGKRAVAEDVLARGVTPIDSDLAAWMSFLQAYAAHPSPFAMLDGAGLGLNDLSRLHRRWSRRMAADESLQKQAAELARKGPGPLPPIRVEPAVLKLFPWSPGPAPVVAPPAPKVAVPADTSLAPGKLRLYSYVAVKAHLAENPGDDERTLKKLGVQDFATTDAGWQVILRGDPELERDYRSLLDAQRAKLRAAKRSSSAPGGAGPAPPPAPAAAAPAPAPAPAAAAAPGAAAPAPAMPVVRPAPSKLAGTSLALDVPHKPALPFAAGAPPAPPPPAAPPPAPAAAAPMPPPRSDLAGTSLALDVPHKAALPFAAGAPPAPAAVAPRPPPRPDLAGTSLALDIPRRAALPFPAAQPSPLPPPAPASPEAPTVPEPPALTLQQHASLCCEIAQAPERALETLARYGITPDQKRAADQHYAERFAREPGTREAWDRAYQTYRTWLAGRVSR
jgi:hypothetical protein